MRFGPPTGVPSFVDLDLVEAVLLLEAHVDALSEREVGRLFPT